ncbi:MAG: hypothetical protein KME21_22240 [Desmonostoc vinosum HA7617-LM4]|nr:hypothetical protein [Desmonostoc vinosum HA7617-LM4]
MGSGEWGVGSGEWGLGVVISSPASLACPALTGVGILHSIRIKPIFSFQNLSVRLPVPLTSRLVSFGYAQRSLFPIPCSLY